MVCTIQITAKSASIQPKPNSGYVVVTVDQPTLETPEEMVSFFPSYGQMLEFCRDEVVDGPGWDETVQNWLNDDIDDLYIVRSDLAKSDDAMECLKWDIEHDVIEKYMLEHLRYAHDVEEFLNKVDRGTLLVAMQDIIQEAIDEAFKEVEAD